jgi:hypothetical protein
MGTLTLADGQATVETTTLAFAAGIIAKVNRLHGPGIEFVSARYGQSSSSPALAAHSAATSAATVELS